MNLKNLIQKMHQPVNPYMTVLDVFLIGTSEFMIVTSVLSNLETEIRIFAGIVGILVGLATLYKMTIEEIRRRRDLKNKKQSPQ
jgi:uncharacterized membrane protein YuzA (DUF378 family)